MAYLIVLLAGLLGILALLMVAFHWCRPERLRISVRLAPLLHVEFDIAHSQDHRDPTR